MNTTSKSIMAVGVLATALLAGTAMFLGCKKEQHGDKYLAYAETAGKTVAYAINLSDKFTDKDVKATVQTFLTNAIPLIPTELSPASVKDELVKVKDAVMAKIDIPETIRPMVSTAIDLLLDFAYVGLDKIAAKYETECQNAEIYYSIVYKFVTTVDATLGRLSVAPPVAVAAKDAKGAYAYDVANAAVGGLDKDDYEELIEAILARQDEQK